MPSVRENLVAELRSTTTIDSRYIAGLLGAPVFRADNVSDVWFSDTQKAWNFSLSDLPGLRLPYPDTWVEFPFPLNNDIRKMGAENTPFDRIDSYRCGVALAEAPGDRPDSFVIYAMMATEVNGEILWYQSASNKKPVAFPLTWRFDVDALGNAISQISYICRASIPHVAIEKFEYINSAVLGCSLMTISLLNCANTEVVTVEPVRGKRRRKKAGSFGIKYNVVKIKGNRQRRVYSDSDFGGARKAFHIRRGHIKHYGPDAPLFGKIVGNFYWTPHTVGDIALGEVNKHYVVEAE